MSNMDTPVVEFETSSAFDIKPTRVKLRFNEPIEKEKQGKYGDGSYILYIYSVEHNGEDHVMFAYTGLYNAIQKTGAGQDCTIDIVKFGEGKETKWEVALVDGEPVVANEQPRQQGRASGRPTAAPVRPSEYQPLTATDKEAMYFIMRERLALFADAYSIALNELDQANQLEPEQLVSIAHGLVITAEKQFKRGMIAPGSEQAAPENGNSVDEFIATVRAEGDQVLSGILNGIVAVNEGRTREEAINALKTVGVKSARDIDASEPDTWVRVLNIVTEYFNLVDKDVPSEEAVRYVRELYKIPAQPEPAF